MKLATEDSIYGLSKVISYLLRISGFLFIPYIVCSPDEDVLNENITPLSTNTTEPQFTYLCSFNKDIGGVCYNIYHLLVEKQQNIKEVNDFYTKMSAILDSKTENLTSHIRETNTKDMVFDIFFYNKTHSGDPSAEADLLESLSGIKALGQESEEIVSRTCLKDTENQTMILHIIVNGPESFDHFLEKMENFLRKSFCEALGEEMKDDIRKKRKSLKAD